MILITGASRGIGKYLIQRFWETGESAYGTYNLTHPESNKPECFARVDVCNYSDVSNWIDSIKDELTKLSLINCAGVNYNSFAHKADIDNWAHVINVNLIGSFNVIRAVLPYMRKQQFGRIINLSSVVAQIGVPGTSAYASSKAGLWGLTRSIAVENAKKGITINSLNLGYFNLGVIQEVPEEFQKVLKEKIPAGDFGHPEQIFNAVKFIMETDYLNGVSVDLNGGLH